MNPQTITPVKTGPKDFFLHLGATIILYSGVIALINLLFAVINHTFPDKLGGYFYASSVSWPISTLVVLTPVLFLIAWVIQKDITLVPEKKQLWVYRWRVFLTLFLTAATIIGDLVALINTYLNGEVSERFFYKFLAILVVFGIVFLYYVFERIGGKKNIQNVLVVLGAIAVIVAIVLGFTTVGSPASQRSIRFDNQRVNDLQNLQSRIIGTWQEKGKLPATLTEYNDPLSGYKIPTDPRNESPYVYNLKSDKSFELCATFEKPTQENKGRGGYYDYSPYYYPGGTNESWKHEKGYTCFTRTIDPEKYPVYKKPSPVAPY